MHFLPLLLLLLRCSDSFGFLDLKAEIWVQIFPLFFYLVLIYTGVITRWNILLNQGDMI